MSDIENDIELPDGIGPHEGRELELMLAGEKPVAVFGDSVTPTFDWGEADWLPHVDAGRFIKTCQIVTKLGIDLRLVYFCQPDQVASVEELQKINADLCVNPRFDPAMEQRIGELLGYEAWQIDAYIAHCQSFAK